MSGNESSKRNDPLDLGHLQRNPLGTHYRVSRDDKVVQLIFFTIRRESPKRRGLDCYGEWPTDIGDDAYKEILKDFIRMHFRLINLPEPDLSELESCNLHWETDRDGKIDIPISLYEKALIEVGRRDHWDREVSDSLMGTSEEEPKQ